MGLLRGIALLFVTLFGLAAGATIAERGRHPRPSPLDLLLVLVVWLTGLRLAPALGHWLSLLAVLLGAAAAAAIRGAVRRARPLDADAVRAQAVRHHHAAVPHARGWRAFLLELGNFQGRMTLLLLYFLLLPPFALIARFAKDPLRLRRPGGGTFWQERGTDADADLASARRQF